MNGGESVCRHHELAVGWALHCLEPGEEALFGEHLPRCEQCRRTVADTEEVGAALAFAAPSAVPSPELEERLMAAINASEDEGEQADQQGEDGHDERSRRARRAPLRSGGALLAAAVGIVLVAVSAFLGVWLVQLNAERDRLAAQADVMSRVMQRVAEPGTTSTALVNDDGELQAVLVAASEGITLVSIDLPANDAEGQSYVLWGVSSSGPVALASFDVSEHPPVVHTVSSIPEAEAFAAFAVSLEPGNEPPAQPSDVVASGQVES